MSINDALSSVDDRCAYLCFLVSDYYIRRFTSLNYVISVAFLNTLN